MNFFVPAAKDTEEAEKVYAAFADHIHAQVKNKRIWKLTWRHNDKINHCEIGRDIEGDERFRGQPVLAIFDCDNYFMICTPDRGVLHDGPILAENDIYTEITYFD